jgi:hypothetical protein
MERFFLLLKSKGHKLREVVTDAESIFTAQEALIHKYDAVLIQSPPYEHHINGMVERMIGVVQSITLGFMLNANWLSPVFWSPLWQQAEKTLLWRRSMIDGDLATRMESFYRVTPDFKKHIMLPPGAILAFRVGDAKFKPGSVKKKAGLGFYLGPADGIDGGVAVYSLATRRIRQARTWRLLQQIPQFLMRYDHSRLFNGDDPKLSDLASDDHNLGSTDPGQNNSHDDEDEIYDEDDMQFTVRPDPLYSRHHAVPTESGQELPSEFPSEGADPTILNHSTSLDDSSSAPVAIYDPNIENPSGSFFDAASSSVVEPVLRVRRRLRPRKPSLVSPTTPSESIFRVSLDNKVKMNPRATILSSASFKRVRIAMITSYPRKVPATKVGIQRARHYCYSEDTGYSHINNLRETRSMWQDEGLRNNPLADYSDTAFQQLTASVEFDFMVKHVQERSDAVKAESILFDDAKIYRWYTLGHRGYPNADTIRGFITDSLQHDLDETNRKFRFMMNISDRNSPVIAAVQENQHIIVDGANDKLAGIKSVPKTRLIGGPPDVYPAVSHSISRPINMRPHAIIQAIPVIAPGQDIDLALAIYDSQMRWPFFQMNDPNNVPNLDIDIYYPYLRRLDDSSSPVAIGWSLLEGAGRGLFATRDIRKGETLGIYGGPQSDDPWPLRERWLLEHYDNPSRGLYDSEVDGPYRYTLSDQRSYPYFANDPLGRPDLVNSHLVWDNRRHRGILQSTDDIARGDEIFNEYGSEFWREFRYDLTDPFDYSIYLSYGAGLGAWYPVPDFL